jgi:phosphoribosylformylglycinamidine synthase
MKARVFVTLKRSVLDPQGQAVQRALAGLGFGEVEDVRIGKVLEMRLAGEDRDKAKVRVEEMCRKLLANMIIEEFRVELVEVPDRGSDARSTS